MATSVSAVTASAQLNGQMAPRQFQGSFDILPFTCELLDTSIPAGAAQADVTVPGAALGDFVFLACQIDQVDVSLSAWVASAGVVTVAIVTHQHVDATTTFATTAKKFNGFILKPKANLFDQVA